MINTESVLGILKQSIDVLTKFAEKITNLVMQLRNFTQLDLTLKASDFLAMCSQIRKLTDFYESNVVQPQEEANDPEDFDWLFL